MTIFQSTRRPALAALRKAMRETEQIMAQHTIKINRALRASAIGGCPASAAAMLAAIPQSVLATASSRQIAELIDANWSLAQEAKALAERASIDQGAIWDARQQRLRDIAA
jgi:hypothetical protein